jgi:hypothetical protein
MLIQTILGPTGDVIAIYYRALTPPPSGHNFLTESDSPLQVGVFNHKRGHEIKRHFHPEYLRELKTTSEVLIVQQGVLEAQIYDENQRMLTNLELKQNDILALFKGGHAFFASTDCIIIEVKQGPYAHGQDKVLF